MIFSDAFPFLTMQVKAVAAKRDDSSSNAKARADILHSSVDLSIWQSAYLNWRLLIWNISSDISMIRSDFSMILIDSHCNREEFAISRARFVATSYSHDKWNARALRRSPNCQFAVIRRVKGSLDVCYTFHILMNDGYHVFKVHSIIRPTTRGGPRLQFCQIHSRNRKYTYCMYAHRVVPYLQNKCYNHK